MNTINCIAIDDEPLALDIIKDYAKRVPFLNLMATFDNAVDCMSYLKSNPVDLMFLDIQMEELTGIQLLSALKEKPQVIFTTAYDQFALKGYELDVLDYLLKPISFERFLKAADKAYDKLMAKPEAKAAVTEIIPQKTIDYCFVKSEFHLEKVNFAEVLYIEGMGDYLMIHTPTRKIMTLQSFKKVEETFPAENFCRVHKSYIVAIDKIESIERNRIKIGNILIPVSDSYKKDFFAMIEKRGML
ncbi:MAG TPA: LytTR family DNA-binding domain-containing protein [Bacteroidales bacterium]|nr:LytTR family DNA-binding domain-containing protein [Bacteroidales bacterium]